MSTLKQSIDIPLQVPVDYKDSDGKQATRSTLTFGRPNLKHAKQLAVIVGPQLASLLMPAIKSNTNDINTETMSRRPSVTASFAIRLVKTPRRLSKRWLRKSDLLQNRPSRYNDFIGHFQTL